MGHNHRITELDGLRGIAIISVIAFHLGLRIRLPEVMAAVANFGWSGVDLFFVLSGFLIGGILIDHRESAQYYLPFYARRIFRIVPLYLAILGIYGVLWLTNARSTLIEYALPPMPWYTYLTFTNNFWISAHDNMGVFIAPTWSLAIEEQFYLALPLIVRFVRPRFLMPTVCALSGLIFGLRAYFVFFLTTKQHQVYTLPWFREDALLIGVICAILIRQPQCRSFLDKHYYILLAIPAASGFFLFWFGAHLYPVASKPLLAFGLSIVASLYGAILLLVLVRPKHFGLLRLGALTEIGKVSYCLYLIHTIVIEIGAKLLQRYGDRWSVPQAWFLVTVTLFVMFLLAQLSWETFESPMLGIGHRFSFKQRLASGVPTQTPKFAKEGNRIVGVIDSKAV